MMNDNLRKRFKTSSTLNCKYVKNIRGINHFEDDGLCLFMAGPGMLQDGLCLELFEQWRTSTQNGLVLRRYSAEQTLRKQFLREPDKIQRLDGKHLKLACSCNYITFAAHADLRETRLFVEDTNPTHCILAHGEKNNMARVKADLDNIHNKAEERKNLDPHSPVSCGIV